jgi:hypothetical protein
MQNRPGEPKHANKDDEINPRKTAPDFGSLELDGRQFQRHGTRNISKFPVSNNLFRVTVWRRGGDQQFRIADYELNFEEGLCGGELSTNPQFEIRNPQFFDAVYLPRKMI